MVLYNKVNQWEKKWRKINNNNNKYRVQIKRQSIKDPMVDLKWTKIVNKRKCRNKVMKIFINQMLIYILIAEKTMVMLIMMRVRMKIRIRISRKKVN